MTDMEFPPDMPEEVKEFLRHQKDRQIAHIQDNTHAIRTFFEELDKEQLNALDMLIANVGMDPKYNVGYFRGQITQLQYIKFGVCPCGEEHDPDELLKPEIVRPGTPEYPPKGTFIEDVELPDPHLPDYDPDALKSYIKMPDSNETVQVDSERWYELLKTYGLREIIDSETEARKFECIACGYSYPSLQDRALKPSSASGCPGCVHKNMWG